MKGEGKKYFRSRKTNFYNNHNLSEAGMGRVFIGGNSNLDEILESDI